ncbi:tyrosine-type recombinase/integrase [Streptomyces sp. HNM0663]|uniref:Tyrosine-type recombinase/integrase n=1 Tax=Streptomyces chengmaiensis TaxID=3040919 RepID=A0ABT6HSG3_9ACTN|nr:tyrosine-type recombinase/integrase [Streptomyces chengmaiensis]MDH2391262.1 tyrosine-type recombinase/integrase [Streptomyces chengmaiensis]
MNVARVWIEDRASHADYQAAVEKWQTAKKVGSKRNPPGRWRVRWYGPDGKPKAKTFQKMPQAEAEKRAIEERLEKGTYRDPKQGKVQFSDIAEEWFESLRKQGERTRNDYRELLDLYVIPKWGEHRVASIAWEDVSDWVNELCSQPGKRGGKLSPARIAKIYLVFGMVMKRAVQSGKIPSSPATDHELPPIGDDGEHVYLSHEQLAGLAEAAGEYRTLILVLGYCGIRWGEATALEVARVQLDTRRLRIVQAHTRVKGGMKIGPVKNHERRSAPVLASLVEDLRPLTHKRKRDDLLWVGAGGTHLRYSTWRPAVFDQAVKAAGLEGLGITPHKLRHTAASLAIAAGADVKVVQLMLGHKSAAMTLDVYGHLWPDRLDEVADVLDSGRKAALAKIGEQWKPKEDH